MKGVENEESKERDLSGEQSVSGPKLLSCQQERGCQDSEMTSANQMERKWHHQTRMSLSRERNVSEENGSIKQDVEN